MNGGQRRLILKKLVFLLLFPALVWAQFPSSYVGGEVDVVTPAIRILKINQHGEIKFRLSEEFDFCGECAGPLPGGYGQEGQVSGQGHVHAYWRLAGKDIRDNRQADIFCAFNAANAPDQLNETDWRGYCPQPEKGKYLVCISVETNAHTQRVKAHPRDFPPVDCKKHKQKKQEDDNSSDDDSSDDDN